MHTQCRGLGARAVLAAALCFAGALASPVLADTYTFKGLIADGLLDVIEAGPIEAGGGGLQTRGELQFDHRGLSAAQMESAGLLMFISRSGDQTYDLLIESTNKDLAFTLTEVKTVLSSDLITIDGVITTLDGATAALRIEATELTRVDDGDGMPADGGGPEGGIGPDVTTSRVGLTSAGLGSDDFSYWGTAGGIRAFSIASTSCNIGDELAEWVSGPAGNHPVIGQNVFRFQNGRFEHIGQSWLKHSFCAVSEFTCGACMPTGCPTLGLGCADTYSSFLNDGRSGGPKSLINPQGQGPGGTHNNHNWIPPFGPTDLRGRLQIHDADILAGGRFVAEIQYVTHDEALDIRHNNASWREINLTLTGMSGVGQGQPSVHSQEPGIEAWPDFDSAVKVALADVPDEGRFLVGHRVSNNGDGTWHYEYAVHNLNSDRSAQAFAVPLPDDAVAGSIGFHDVDYHSGEPYDGTDWPSEIIEEGQRSLMWATQTFDEDEGANALRWGTLYNFRFDTNAAPVDGQATITLFKPGTPESLSVMVSVPGIVIACIGDIDGDNMVGAADLAAMIAAWGPNPGSPADLNGDGNVNPADLALLLGSWGPC